jgi:uncharacterized protein YkwD
MRILLLVIALVAFAAPAAAMDLNGYRAKNGRSALRYDASLAGLAYFHAADLARRGALDHSGFSTQRGPLGAAAENVSYGCGDEACAIQQWGNSAPHRVNMLRKGLTSYGIGSAVSASGRRYWVMELGGVIPAVRAQRGRKQHMESATKR